MKLLTLNLNIFEENNEKIVDFLKSHPADIVCLTEVIKPLDNDAKKELDSYSPIKQTLRNLSYNFFAPKMVLDRFYANNFHGEEYFLHEFGSFVEYGNQIHSKHKIISGEVHFVQGEFTYVTNWDGFPETDYRNVQVVDLEVAQNRKIRVINYHGIWSKNKKGNEETIEANGLIHQLATEISYPSIICGDFNLFPETESMKMFDDNFVNLVNEHDIKTTRLESNELASERRNVVDYILVSKSKDIQINSFEVVNSEVSDHLPLIVDFDIV